VVPARALGDGRWRTRRGLSARKRFDQTVATAETVNAGPAATAAARIREDDSWLAGPPLI